MPQACWEVVHTLADLHDWTLSSLKNEDQCDIHNQRSVLDSLVRTILSQNTTDVLSGKAFNDLKGRVSSCVCRFVYSVVTRGVMINQNLSSNNIYMSIIGASVCMYVLGLHTSYVALHTHREVRDMERSARRAR